MALATPFEQAAAEALTGLIITGGQKGNAANIVKRANTALSVTSALAQLNQGNAAAGMALLQSVLANADLDPGVALAVQSAITVLSQQVALLSQIAQVAPLLGATAEAVAQNVLAGVTAAAQAELAKYSAAK